MPVKPKKENQCRLLSESQSEQLAKLLISQTERRYHYGVNRQKNYSAQRCCNSFLKTTFQSTVPSFIIKDYGEDTFNIITQENYDFLRDSYFRYAELLNVKVDHTPARL